jgi:hypothetical protein
MPKRLSARSWPYYFSFCSQSGSRRLNAHPQTSEGWPEARSRPDGVCFRLQPRSLKTARSRRLVLHASACTGCQDHRSGQFDFAPRTDLTVTWDRTYRSIRRRNLG